MDNLDKILDSIETEINNGMDLTNRLATKSFGIFKNPVFLLSFFSVLFTVLGYKLYHYFKRQDETQCYNFKSDKDCPKYCVWDTGDEICQPQLKSGNLCPDYWETSGTGSTIICKDKKSLIPKNKRDMCYTDKDKTQIEIIDGKIGGTRSKCDWMKNCGTWEGQSIGKFGCGQSTEKKNPFKSVWVGHNQ